MPKQYQFSGDPNLYKWEFNLEPGRTYFDNVKVMGEQTIQQLVEIGPDPHDLEFEKEWKEVNNG